MKKQMYPCLWFDGNARAAADFYCAIFSNSKIVNDSGLVVNFELNGEYFMGLNGGPNLNFTEAVSFVIPCKDQAFQAIADPTRRMIIKNLSQGPLNLAAIIPDFDISRQAIAKHIKVLNECGMVSITQKGREQICETN